MDLCAAQGLTLRIAIALTVCLALLPVPGVSMLLSEAAQGQSRTERRNVKPKPGKPEGTLPDLEDVKNESQIEREAAPPVPSTIRSPKNPLKPWNGKRVGDPGTQGQPDQANNNRGERNNFAILPRDQRTRRAHASIRVSPPPPVMDDQ